MLAWERLSCLVLTVLDSDSSFENLFFDFFRLLSIFYLELVWKRLPRLVLTALRFLFVFRKSLLRFFPRIFILKLEWGRPCEGVAQACGLVAAGSSRSSWGHTETDMIGKSYKSRGHHHHHYRAAQQLSKGAALQLYWDRLMYFCVHHLIFRGHFGMSCVPPRASQSIPLDETAMEEYGFLHAVNDLRKILRGVTASLVNLRAV